MISGILIFLVAYVFVYMDYTSKTDAVTAEISALQDRIDQLETYNEKVPAYKNGINENRAAINEALSKYYSAETPEDFIMFATDMEETIGVEITALAFADPLLIYSIAGVTETDDYTVPAKTIELTGYKASSTLDGSMDYSQMKKALDFIYSQNDVTRLDSLSLSFDSSTGDILGSFVIDKYFITGRDIEEHQANIPYTDLGNSVLIGN